MKITLDVEFDDKEKPIRLKSRLIKICQEIEEKYPNKSLFRFKTNRLLYETGLCHAVFYQQLYKLEAEKFLIKRYGEVIVLRENVIHESSSAPSQKPDTTGI